MRDLAPSSGSCVAKMARSPCARSARTGSFAARMASGFPIGTTSPSRSATRSTSAHTGWSSIPFRSRRSRAPPSTGRWCSPRPSASSARSRSDWADAERAAAGRRRRLAARSLLRGGQARRLGPVGRGAGRDHAPRRRDLSPDGARPRRSDQRAQHRQGESEPRPHHDRSRGQQPVQMGADAAARDRPAGGRETGFLQGPEAIRASFQDVKQHMLGTLAGFDAAMRAALELVSPATIAGSVEGRAHLLKGHPPLCWEEYERAHGEVQTQVLAHRDGPVNDAFLAAYEAALSKVAPIVRTRPESVWKVGGLRLRRLLAFWPFSPLGRADAQPAVHPRKSRDRCGPRSRERMSRSISTPCSRSTARCGR